MAKTGGLKTRSGAPDIPDTHRVEAVERALTILEAFDREALTLTLAELSRRTGIYKSTLLRLAGSLHYCGFLLRQDDGRFCLGPAIARLGPLVRSAGYPGVIIRPALDRLVAETGETASFHIREGQERVCLYRRNSHHSARHHLEEGARLPLEQGAAGRVLTAFSEPRSEAGDLIRSRSYFVSIGERDPAVAAVAVPVLDRHGRLHGALAVSGIRGRFGETARVNAFACLNREAVALGIGADDWSG